MDILQTTSIKALNLLLLFTDKIFTLLIEVNFSPSKMSSKHNKKLIKNSFLHYKKYVRKEWMAKSTNKIYSLSWWPMFSSKK